MWFLVLLILGVEFYNYYRQDREQRELEGIINDLMDLKESMESEMKRTRKAVRARERRASTRLSSGKQSDQTNPIRVQARVQEYWKQQGWERENGSYEGYYRTPLKSFRGVIEKNGRGYEFYIYSLPKEVKNGSHSACFKHKGHGKYSIHFARKPKGPSDGIMAVERILREALT